MLSEENYSVRTELETLASLSLVLLEESILRFRLSESGWVFLCSLLSLLISLFLS